MWVLPGSLSPSRRRHSKAPGAYEGDGWWAIIKDDDSAIAHRCCVTLSGLTDIRGYAPPVSSSVSDGFDRILTARPEGDPSGIAMVACLRGVGCVGRETVIFGLSWQWQTEHHPPSTG